VRTCHCCSGPVKKCGRFQNPSRITLKADPESIQERVERYKAEAIKLRNENKKIPALYQAGVAE
jgi:hypothetical protein